MRYFLYGLLVASFILSGCKDYQANYSAAFAPANHTADIVPIGPERLRNSEKRGFADFNGDGLEDMVQINDESFWGQDYQMDVFLGEVQNGHLQFAQAPVRVNLPISFGWFSSAVKMDTADTNGDGYADIVFTQYHEKFGQDELDIAIAVNDGDMGFTAYDLSTTATANAQNYQDLDVFTTLVMYQATGVFYPYEESIYDVLKMDWADMDGNGTDDMILAWDTGSDIDVRIIYTQENPANGIVALRADMASRQHMAYEQVYVEGFTGGFSIRYFDAEDYNGDGVGDMLLSNWGSKWNKTAYLIWQEDHYEPHQTFKGILPKVDMFAAAKKVDTFDVNLDGCADWVRITEQDNRAVMLVQYQACE